MERWKSKIMVDELLQSQQHVINSNTPLNSELEADIDDSTINTMNNDEIIHKNINISSNTINPMPYLIQKRGCSQGSTAFHKISSIHSTHHETENSALDISSIPIQESVTTKKEEFCININDPINDLWLILTDQYNTITQNEHGTIRQLNEIAILTSSTTQRDDYIKSNQTKFSNGYTLKRISTLKQLQNDLNSIYPNQNTIMSPTEIKNTIQLDEIKRFELFRQIIQHEDDLLNQRVSWIILAQSFLMAAFITSPGPSSLRYVTAFVGLGTTIVAMPAIIAAGRNIEVQQQVYFNMLESDDRCLELHGHRREYRKLDVEEEMRRKHYGHLLPTMAFRGKGALSILTTVLMLGAVQFIGWCLLLISFMAS